MATFMAFMVEKYADEKGVEAGRKKYNGYFGISKIYHKWRDQTDLILTTDGYEECITDKLRN